MKIYLTTDTHFEHKKLVEHNYRPDGFENMILDGFKKARYFSTLIHLGDISWKNHAFWADEICNCFTDRILTIGNHDKKNISWYFNNGWFATKTFTWNIYGERILFSHRPQPYDGKYTMNIHGHFHDMEHRKNEPEMLAIKNDKQVCLALENNDYQLFDLQKVVEAYRKGNL